MGLKSTFRDSLEFNERFVSTIELVEQHSNHVLITGKAGTGKSTLLTYFREHTLKNVAILAPTGVAAVNVQGQTIHSFFCFRPDITPENVFTIRLRKSQKEIYRHLDAIVIDEVSMVRADLLDCIDQFLRIYGPYPQVAFGGVQMIFIGDLFQLPPVVTNHERHIFKEIYSSPYFFDSKVFQQLVHDDEIVCVELEKIYRQKEKTFIDLLGHIRNGQLTSDDLNLVNSRVQRNFAPNRDDFFIYLTTTNRLADEINQHELANIKVSSFEFAADVNGVFDGKIFPTHEVLALKIGAQVMLLNNDMEGRWVNGSVGRVVQFKSQQNVIVVELADGELVDVSPFKWEMYKFFYNTDMERLETESVGSFQQYPLRLAWAVTIHKSQGKTFSKVIIDIGSGAFACGQIYVALSRCTHFEGIVLKRPIAKKDILLDEHVIRFMTEFDKKKC